jgi:RNA methyltransferase, TrmH family
MESHERLRQVSSRQHPLIKQLRAAFAHAELTAEGYCAIEGVRMLEEALRAGLRMHAVVFSESALKEGARGSKLLPQIGSHTEAISVPDSVFDSAVATETPQGVAALVKLKDFSFDDIVRGENPLLVVAAGLQDPGNLGTILRSAEAFGASGLLLAEKTVRPFNAKAVRASAGSVFRLPIVSVELASAIASLRERGVRMFATSSHKGSAIDQTDLRGATAIFIGNEGAGLPKHTPGEIDDTIMIPHSERVESLNAGIAASIVLYEAGRQRRTPTTETQRHRDE